LQIIFPHMFNCVNILLSQISLDVPCGSDVALRIPIVIYPPQITNWQPLAMESAVNWNPQTMPSVTFSREPKSNPMHRTKHSCVCLFVCLYNQQSRKCNCSLQILNTKHPQCKHNSSRNSSTNNLHISSTRLSLKSSPKSSLSSSKANLSSTSNKINSHSISNSSSIRISRLNTRLMLRFKCPCSNEDLIDFILA
jgi:hypothetical protein